MSQSAEHTLIFNCVKNVLNRLSGLTNDRKNALANEIAIELRQLVRVKERDEE